MTGFWQWFDNTLSVIKSGISAAMAPSENFLNIFSNYFVGAGLIAVVFITLLIFSIIFYGKQFSGYIKYTKNIVICSLFIALNVVLGYFSIDLSAYLRIGFGFITLPVITSLFGPVAGCLCGILQDGVSYVLKPTGGFLVSYTMCVGISGMIYGFMLYNKKISLWRVFLTMVIITILVNICLSTIALVPTSGKGLYAMLPARIVKNVIMLPIQTGVNYLILKIIKRIKI